MLILILHEFCRLTEGGAGGHTRHTGRRFLRCDNENGWPQYFFVPPQSRVPKSRWCFSGGCYPIDRDRANPPDFVSLHGLLPSRPGPEPDINGGLPIVECSEAIDESFDALRTPPVLRPWTLRIPTGCDSSFMTGLTI